jgi:DNA-directed RNA polymerase subunit RPC12/RpoP
MAEREITCPMCGFANAASAERCQSCGAKVEELSASYSAEDAYERRYQQEHFDWKWAARAAGVYLAAQLVILVGLPYVISTFDPQGLPGLLISVAVWFVGGIVVGLISPGKTFIEPAVGALIAVIPTVSYLAITTPEGFQPTLLAYIVTGLLGVMIALFGAFLGERIQMGGRGPSNKHA